MQKEVEYHNDVAKEINRWASIDPSAVVDLREDRIATLSRNEVAKCCVDRKKFEKVVGFKTESNVLYEIKVTGRNRTQYRLLFIEKNISSTIKVYILHAYVEKNKKHLNNEFRKAFQRAKYI